MQISISLSEKEVHGLIIAHSHSAILYLHSLRHWIKILPISAVYHVISSSIALDMATHPHSPHPTLKYIYVIIIIIVTLAQNVTNSIQIYKELLTFVLRRLYIFSHSYTLISLKTHNVNTHWKCSQALQCI